jgi:hypothetical protein
MILGESHDRDLVDVMRSPTHHGRQLVKGIVRILPVDENYFAYTKGTSTKDRRKFS